LVELLVVVVILPLVVGAITVALLSVFKLQTTTTNRISASGDAQIVSANFVHDVQSGATIWTVGSTQCGAGTQVLGLQWGTGPTTVSYVVVPEGANYSLFRNVCQPAMPESTSVVSHDVRHSLSALVTCASTVLTCATQAVTAAGTPSAGVAGVQLSINEASNYNYSLTAVPRAWTSASGGEPPPVVPVLPLTLLGAGPCPVLTLNGSGTSVTVGGGTGYLGVAATCSPATSIGSATLSAGPVITGARDPFAALVAPSNPSLTGLGTGTCTRSTCSTGRYATGPSLSGVTLSFDPTSAPNPGVFVFDQPVDVAGHSNVTFGGGTDVTKVTYWFRGGLTVEGGSTVTFGQATYLFGDSSAPGSNALNIKGGATISATSGVLFYIEAGPATINGNTNTPILGSTLYDNIAIWDATTSSAAAPANALTLGGSSTVGSPLGGVYDPNGYVILNGGSGLVTSFVVASTVSGTGGTTATIG
jgi:hypothetical protein